LFVELVAADDHSVMRHVVAFGPGSIGALASKNHSDALNWVAAE
jgi:hypothetical protein